MFPGASHNRFEHCIGVGYLAGKWVRKLAKRQLNLEISQRDINCVEVAGLCHDLGHGPFSHAFDSKFLPSVLPQGVSVFELHCCLLHESLFNSCRYLGAMRTDPR